MKSVVVEIKNDFAVVLSDDGSIVKVKNKKYVIGQVIEMKIQKVHITKKMAMMVASVAIVALTSGIGAWAYSSPYSYVSMDVNPSIEYTLNRFERVIDVKAVNDDGQEILDEIDIAGLYRQSIEDAIIQTVEQISQDGYFNEDVSDVITSTEIQEEDSSQTEAGTTEDSAVSIDGGIVITVSNEEGNTSEDLSDSIREVVTDLVGESVEVEVTSVAYERVQAAKELGITPGKLNLIEKLQASAQDPDSIDIQEWMNKPVKDIMKAIKENRKANAKLEEETTDEAENSAEEEIEKAEEDAEKAEEAAEKAEEAAEKAEEAAEKAEEEAEEVKEAEQEAQEDLEEAQENPEEQQAKAQEKATQAQAKAQEKAAQAQAKAQEKADQAQAKAQEKANKAQEKAQEKAAQAREKAAQEQEKSQEKADKAQEKAKNNRGSEE